MLNPLHPARTAGLGIARTLTRRALDNAMSATESLREQTRDRAALRAAADDDTPRGAGEVTRLSRDECLRLLKTRHVGRFAYVARAETPDVVPVNYTVDQRGRILLRSGPGPKLLAAQRHAQIAFEVDDIDEKARSGWSVVVAGCAEMIPERLSAQSSAPTRPWAAGPRRTVIRITPSRVEGRRLS